MASDDCGCAVEATPPKAVGMGAPTSMWIYFEIAEIPALIDAIADEWPGTAAPRGSTGGPSSPRRRRPAGWRYHVGEL